MPAKPSTPCELSEPAAPVNSLTSIIHDIRNPLASVRASAQLGTILAKDNERLAQLFAQIIQDADRTSAQVDRLRTLQDSD